MGSQSDHDDIDALSPEDLQQIGLSMDDLRQLEQGSDGASPSDDHTDLIAELKAMQSGSDFDQNDLNNELDLSDDGNVELPSDNDNLVDLSAYHNDAFISMVDDNSRTSGSLTEPGSGRKSAIEKEIHDLQLTAIQLNRGGKKPQALQIMAKIRRLKALLVSANDGGLNSSQIADTINNTVGSVSSKSAPSPSVDALADVTSRLQLLMTEAVRLKRSGDIESVRALLPKISILKGAKAKIENGEAFDLASLDAGVNSQPEPNSAAAAKLPGRDELFHSLERDLKSQLVRVYEEAKQVLQLEQKDEARKIMAIKVRTERDLETLARIRSMGETLPTITRTRRSLSYLRQFEHIGSNQIELEIAKAEQLSPPSGWKLCSSFVSYELNFPKDSVQKGVTQTIVDSDDPVFAFKKLLSFPRPKRVPRLFNFVKVVFSVQVPRMVLFKPIVIGTAELKLGDLLEKSDISAAIPLKGGRGKLHVAVRLRNPLSGHGIAKKIVEDLTIQNDPVASPALRTAPASPAVATTSAPGGTSRVPTNASSSPRIVVGIPAGINEEDWKDPHRISSLRSNDVMQWVIDKLLQTIGTYRAKGLSPPTELLQQFQQVSALKQQLEQQVEDGALTFPMYLDILRDDIKRLTLLHYELAQVKRTEDAEMVLSRLKIEKDELDSAGSSES